MEIKDTDIAVVGMAGRFPQAPDLAAFWDNLREGRECISFFSDEALLKAGAPAHLLDDPRYVKAQGILDEAECFDPAFFDMNQGEAELIDPQQRLFLQIALHALEDAACNPDSFDGRISVYAGASNPTYQIENVLPNLKAPTSSKRFQVMVSNDKDFLATRAAYKLNLKGASYTVQTACSTSLAATHMACQALLSGECDMALAGGSTLKVPQVTGYQYEEGQIFSPQGRIHAFDDRADGIVLGNGVGAIALKRLADAIADGDRIHAVIKATAANNDGGFKASYAAPSREGQMRVIREAQVLGEIPADTIQHVEAHGTGTKLGDPVEVAALTAAFRRSTAKAQFCAIGSVKASIGHLDAAAGVAGLIKTILMLKNRQMAPSVNYRSPNPAINFPETPFYVSDTLRPWPRGETPRRAAVSSFGIGGTNAHAILEEAPEPEQGGDAPEACLLVHSAKSETALEQLSTASAARLAAFNPCERADLAYTLAIGRRGLDSRRMAVFNPHTGETLTQASAQRDPQVRAISFFFTDAPETADPAPLHAWPAFAEKYDEAMNVFEAPLNAAQHLFAMHQGLAGLWRALSEEPARVGGQGVGMLSAAVDAGALTLAQAAAILDGDAAGPAALPRTPVIDGGGASIAADRLGDSDFWRNQLLEEAAAPDLTTDDLRLSIPIVPADYAGLLALVGRVWLSGAAIDWRAFYANQPRRRIDAPLYPFDKVRCWIDPPGSENQAPRDELALFEPSWTTLGEPADVSPSPCSVVAFGFADIDGAENRSLSGIGPERFEVAALALAERLRCQANDRLLQVVIPLESGLSGLAAMLRTARMEAPRLKAQCIEAPQAADAKALDRILADAATRPERDHLRYLNGAPDAPLWHEISLQDAPTPWRAGETYVITGGLGGVGRLFAEAIVSVGAHAVLIGRSAPSVEALGAISGGGSVRYLQADAADAVALAKALKDVKTPIRGVLHAAGALADRLLINQPEDAIRAVLRPKVAGLAALDAATQDQPLDFFVAFSSAVAAIGNPGQAAYAAANAYMEDALARRSGPGRSLAIAWPIWRDGAMRAGAAAEAAMAHAVGMRPMSTGDGLRAFNAALTSGASTVLAVAGDRARAQAYFTQPKTAVAALGDADLRGALIAALKIRFADVVKWDPDSVDPNEPFEVYGVDSVSLAALGANLGEAIPGASMMLLLENPTLNSLADALTAEHVDACRAWLGAVEAAAAPQEIAAAPAAPAIAPTKEPVAIIGLSGRYPGGEGVAGYWETLRSGASPISDIPIERWPLAGFYEPDKTRAAETGRSHLKIGAFLEGAADFDATFFNIAPRDALAMDPQERLFLQACWSAFEDAGLAPSRLSPQIRARAGVYGGVTKTGYALWSKDAQILHTSFSGMVNRASHQLDLGGPSMAVDAMCASSLAAVAQAVRALRAGEIDLAAAGGVNLYLHPSSYGFLSQAGMLADGRAGGAFEAGGAGFVPSEGVGVCLLKRLSDAQRDGDDILALIRGAAVNHNGRAGAYQAPNPAKQAAVIAAALDDAGLSPEAIDYLELAANGAELADAAEQRAIRRVFGDTQDPKRRMGTLKPLMGHGEAVSGMAQLTKAAMQLRTGALCPTPLADRVAPEIDLARAPFVVQTEAAEWPRRGEGPLRAGINSFGAGGVNAHLVIESYAPAPAPAASGPIVFVLSAKSEAALRAYLAKWVAFLERNPDLDLRRAAYTLQTGREAMAWRFACAAQTVSDLRAALANIGALTQAKSGRGLDQAHARIAAGDWSALAALWAGGAAVPWEDLYEAAPRRLAQLPTYPFQGRRYWPNAGPAPAKDQTPPPKTESPSPRPAVEDFADARRRMEAALRQVLGSAPEDVIDPDARFWELGLSSVLVVRFTAKINDDFGLSLSDTITFDYGSLNDLASHVCSLIGAPEPTQTPAPPSPDDLDAILSGVLDGDMSLNDADALLNQL